MNNLKTPPVRPTRPADFVPLPPELVEKSVPALFEANAAKQPDQIAVTCNGVALTYRELDRRSNALANRIVSEAGAGKEPVAILAGLTERALIAILGTLKSGRPYIGLDSSFPPERMKQIVSDSGTRLVLTDGANHEMGRALAQAGVALVNIETADLGSEERGPGIVVESTDLATIFYTSGSTGQPKGVAWKHEQFVSNSIHQVNQAYTSPSDRCLLINSIAFASSRTSIYDTLLSGGAICIYDIKAKGAASIVDFLISERVTILRCPTPVLRTIFGPLPDGFVFPDIRLGLMGGQAPTAQDVTLFRRHTRPDSVFGNHFAATEVGILSNYLMNRETPIDWDVLPAASLVLEDKEILLLDENGRAVPTGEVGEIVVRGRYISSGYLNDPELTAQKFKKDPENPQLTVFYTSDLGRWNPAGYLEHLGRKDFTVKIRGYRVQLEAVEAALTNIPGIRDAAAAAFQPEGGGRRLVAYLTPAQADRPTVGAIRRALAANLPEYMIPSVFIWLDELPRTSSGKVDRNQLPPPSGVRPDIGIAYVAPRTALEEQIAAIWKESLRLGQVGAEDDFFELGGDSLLALDMAVKVERLAGRPLPLGFFEKPTVARLADLLTSGSPDTGWSRRRGWTGAGKWSRTNRTWREAVDRQYSRRDLSRILGWAVGAWVMRKSYADGIRWLSWWVRQPFAKSLYRADLDLFARFVDSIQGYKNVAPDMLDANLFGNLTAGMRFPGADWDLTVHYMDRLRRSPYRYWRDLASVIEGSSSAEFDRYFEFSGVEHVERARQGGKGVIVVSYHSLGSHASIEGLARRLGVEDIPTISQNQDRETAPQEQVTTRDSARFARTALQAQRLLEQGGIVQIVSDADYGRDGKYRAVLGGREYSLKLGFADLAANTGARVVPKISLQLADGKLMSTLKPPFDEGAGGREERTLRLVQQYIDFINSSWREFPESLRWSRIVRHFRQPLAAQ